VPGFGAKNIVKPLARPASPDVPFASERVVVGTILLISVSTAAVLVGLWYYSFVRYNRRRGVRALHWVESACARHGRIVEAQWSGASRLHAQLHFAANWVENARVTIRLLPRPLPFQWFISRWHKQKETITFEADLDCPPTLHLDVMRHRWLTQPSSKVSRKSKQWTISRPGPVVLTTSTEWREELPPIVNTLMTTRGHSLVSVRLRPESPHLAATIDLENLSNEAAAASFLGVLRDLAGASTFRQ
jgi:hypothetical protein